MNPTPSPFHPFDFPINPDELPQLFTCPFYYHPHPLAAKAAKTVQQYLTLRTDWTEELSRGKMFGVLVVQKDTHIGFLAAYSGLLAGRNDHAYFVPPVYDLLQPDGTFKMEEKRISGINRHIQALAHGNLSQTLSRHIDTIRAQSEKELAETRAAMKEAKWKRDEIRTSPNGKEMERQLIRESQFQKAEYKRLEKKWKAEAARYLDIQNKLNVRINALKHARKTRSEALQEWLFAQFRMLNAQGEEKDLWQIFREHGRTAPPSGAGECAAPKLLQYAFRNGYHPLAMAEFWWGASPETEIRQHGHFYPACKSKCEPILGHMLQGLEVEPNVQETQMMHPAEPSILYEDEWLVAVNKPAGMLSVPNADNNAPSVLSWAQEHFPHATGSLVVHRLDMDTSGILLIAKDRHTFVLLQQQFEHRQIKKRYIAILDGLVATDKGTISLPLLPNINDRPRQMVAQNGKTAITRYQVVTRQDGHTRITFYPETGRTHQLRVHAAHPQGLNAPIMGDNLYGKPADRLYLHAESICFVHPQTGTTMDIHSPVPF